MLIEFKVANYRSIRAEQTLSMVASNYSDELPQNLISCDHVPGLKGTKLVKAVALYGANASGKSNVVAALRFFAEFVRDSATKLQPGAPTGAQPFKLDPKSLSEPSKFEINAVINGIRTLYGIEMTRERVTSEYLVAYPKGRPQVWFERDWDGAKGEYEWSKSTEHFKHDVGLHEKTREESAFVSVAAQFANIEAQNIINFFNKSLLFVDPSRDDARLWAAGAILESDKMSKLFISLLKRADIGVIEARVRKANASDVFQDAFADGQSKTQLMSKFALTAADSSGGIEANRMVNQLEMLGNLAKQLGEVVSSTANKMSVPELLHGRTDNLVSFSYLDDESVGTRRYVAILADFFRAHLWSATVVADELETSIHPLLVREAIEAFQGGAFPDAVQLIFTTHNPLLLDQTLLRRDQIWFTEKDQEGATRLYPLTDFKPRKEESLVKGYLAGRYGGIPFIPEGLKF